MPTSTPRAYLEIVRLPNVFTAAADILMGFLVVRGLSDSLDAWLLGLLIAASCSLYCGGVVLNDLFDFAPDARLRPNRPLPSGRISLRAARRLGWTLLASGVFLGGVAAGAAGQTWPLRVAALLAACVLLYNIRLKRTPCGPLAMGACRSLNVLLGMSASTAPWQPEYGVIAGAVGIYITGVTWYARREAGQSDRRHLAAATAVMLLAIGLLAALPAWTDRLTPLFRQEPGRWRLFMGLMGLIIAGRCLAAAIEPTPQRVQTAVKQCLLSLIVLDAAVCLASSGLPGAMAILLLLIPATFLGTWLDMT